MTDSKDDDDKLVDLPTETNSAKPQEGSDTDAVRPPEGGEVSTPASNEIPAPEHDGVRAPLPNEMPAAPGDTDMQSYPNWLDDPMDRQSERASALDDLPHAPNDTMMTMLPEQANVAHDTDDGVRPPPDDHPIGDTNSNLHYMEPFGPNDREAAQWNIERQAILDHPMGASQQVSDSMGWNKAGDVSSETPSQPKDQIVPNDASDNSSIAHDIAYGHAFDKHKDEFPNVETKQDLATVTRDIMDRNEPKELERERKAYWDDGHDAMVIFDPNHPDLGTIYKPKHGKKAYDALV